MAKTVITTTFSKALKNVNSVETLAFDYRRTAGRTEAESTKTRDALKELSLFYIAGGDQSEYLDIWDKTQVPGLLKSIVDRGGAVGGTSAGLHILTGVTYDPAPGLSGFTRWSLISVTEVSTYPDFKALVL